MLRVKCFDFNALIILIIINTTYAQRNNVALEYVGMIISKIGQGSTETTLVGVFRCLPRPPPMFCVERLDLNTRIIIVVVSEPRGY